MPIVGLLLLGWGSGWLVNYLSDVLPIHRRFSRPACVHCQAAMTWRDFLFFRACRACGQRRPLRSWLVQAAGLVLAVFLFFFPPARLGFWIGYGLLILFAVIAVIDLENRVILLPVNLIGALVGLMIGWMIRGPLLTLLGGIAGFGLMFLLYYLGILFNRLVGRMRGQAVDEVALGYGDVYLMGGLGLIMGWPEVVGGLILAILLGGLVSGLFILVTWLLRRYQPLTAIPYAPFLLLAAVIMIYLPKT